MIEDFEDVTHLFNRSCGIYVLLDGDAVCYVGQSRDVVYRVNIHRRDMRFKFNKVLVRYCEPHQLDRLETELIKQYKPLFNKVLYIARDPIVV